MNRYKMHHPRYTDAIWPGQVWASNSKPSCRIVIEKKTDGLWEFSGIKTTWSFVSEETLRKGWHRLEPLQVQQS